MERDLVELRQRLRVAVVADDGDDVAAQLARVPAIQQVGQTVVVPADEQRQPRALRRALEAHLHGEARGDLGERGGEAVGAVERQREVGEVPLDAHEEELELGVLVLIGVHDVGAVPIEELGHGGDDAALVGTVDEQGGGVAHAMMVRQKRRAACSSSQRLQLLPAGVQAIDLGAGGVERSDERGHLGGAGPVDRRVLEGGLEPGDARLGGADRRLDALELLLLLDRSACAPRSLARPRPATAPRRALGAGGAAARRACQADQSPS